MRSTRVNASIFSAPPLAHRGNCCACKGKNIGISQRIKALKKGEHKHTTRLMKDARRPTGIKIDPISPHLRIMEFPNTKISPTSASKRRAQLETTIRPRDTSHTFRMRKAVSHVSNPVLSPPEMPAIDIPVMKRRVTPETLTPTGAFRTNKWLQWTTW